MPFVRRTRATFRSAEFGFFGVRVMTWRHTPRRCGAPRPSLVVCLRVFSVRRSAGAFTFLIAGLRPLRTSWLMVGNENLAFVLAYLMTVAAFSAEPTATRQGCPSEASAEGAHRGTHEGVPHAGHRNGSIRNRPIGVNRATLRATPGRTGVACGGTVSETHADARRSGDHLPGHQPRDHGLAGTRGIARPRRCSLGHLRVPDPALRPAAAGCPVSRDHRRRLAVRAVRGHLLRRRVLAAERGLELPEPSAEAITRRGLGIDAARRGAQEGTDPDGVPARVRNPVRAPFQYRSRHPLSVAGLIRII